MSYPEQLTKKFWVNVKIERINAAVRKEQFLVKLETLEKAHKNLWDIKWLGMEFQTFVRLKRIFKFYNNIIKRRMKKLTCAINEVKGDVEKFKKIVKLSNTEKDFLVTVINHLTRLESEVKQKWDEIKGKMDTISGSCKSVSLMLNQAAFACERFVKIAADTLSVPTEENFKQFIVDAEKYVNSVSGIYQFIFQPPANSGRFLPYQLARILGANQSDHWIGPFEYFRTSATSALLAKVRSKSTGKAVGPAAGPLSTLFYAEVKEPASKIDRVAAFREGILMIQGILKEAVDLTDDYGPHAL